MPLQVLGGKLCSPRGMIVGIRGVTLRRGALVVRAVAGLRFGASRSHGR
jgi:hypothetical protein